MNPTPSKNIMRILDANFNRSREGLRVCEDISRFILNSTSITKDLKLLRHDISEIAKVTSAQSKIFFESRNSKDDVGRASKTYSEMKRRGVNDIFAANMERVKESLRVLEEFFKLINSNRSARFSELRFRAYDLEKKAIRRLERANI